MLNCILPCLLKNCETQSPVRALYASTSCPPRVSNAQLSRLSINLHFFLLTLLVSCRAFGLYKPCTPREEGIGPQNYISDDPPESTLVSSMAVPIIDCAWVLLRNGAAKKFEGQDQNIPRHIGWPIKCRPFARPRTAKRDEKNTTTISASC